MAGKVTYHGQLGRAVYSSWVALAPRRQLRRTIAAYQAGERWMSCKTGAKPKGTRPINIVSLWKQVIGRRLMSQNARCLLDTWSLDDFPVAAGMEKWINDESIRTDLAGNVFLPCIVDALASMGIAMTAIATPEDAEMSNYDLKAGDPFTDLVDEDDHVYDVTTRSLQRSAFRGHFVRVPLDMVRDSSRFSSRRKDLTASDPDDTDLYGDTKLRNIGREDIGINNEICPMVELGIVWCARENSIKTFWKQDLMQLMSEDTFDVKPLEEKEWIGPRTGPYRYLYFDTVIGNAHPKSPVLDALDLDDNANSMMRKLMLQAKDQKNNTLYQRSGHEDAERLSKACDGEFVGMDNPQMIVEHSNGGPAQSVYQLYQEAVNRADWLLGNMSVIGGLQSDANTLGQEQMLEANSGGQIANFQDSTYKFVSQIYLDRLFYWWNHPEKEYQTRYEVPGLPDYRYVQTIYPANHRDGNQMRRRGPMPTLKIDPYSMHYESPMKKANNMMEVLGKAYAPFAQIAMQQGVVPEFQELFQSLARYYNDPAILRLFTLQEPMQQGQDDGGGKPAQTSREYIRRNVGGDSAKAKSADLNNMLAGSASTWNGQLQRR